jgi:malate dehydrogenase (oxaloacetate-decarboxylating)
MAIKQYRHEFRRPRGVYLSINQVNDIEEAFSNFGAGADDIDLILIGTSGAAGSFTE